MTQVKRSRLELVFAILEQCKTGATSPYRITFGANINCTEGRKYLDFLCEKGLLICVDAKPKMSSCRRTGTFNRVRYLLTDQGKTFWKTAQPVIELSLALSSNRSLDHSTASVNTEPTRTGKQ